MKVTSIKIENIEQNENSRVIYKTVDLAELMSSMKKDGLLQPVGVRRLSGDKFEAVFGNRRILAAKKLGWKDIACHVVDIDNDNDRDIIGLVENLKRQNTSVAEDGRIFQILKERGLSESEIAARLDVSETRIKLALDVISAVPQEFRSKIVYKSPVDKRKSVKDQIPASTALAILNTRKSTGLNRAQTRTLFAAASDKGLSISQIQSVAPLIKMGTTLEEALERVSDLERVIVVVHVTRSTATKLEKKYKKSLSDLFTEHLQSSREFQIQKMPSGTGYGFRKRFSQVTAELTA